MATFSSKAVSSGWAVGAYVYLELTETKKSAGVSTITWTLKGKGRSSSPKYFNTKGSVTVYQGTTKKLGLDLSKYNTEQGDTGKVARYDDHQWASGSFDVTHDSSGNATLSITINPTHIYTTSSAFKNTGTMKLSNNPAYNKATISKPTFSKTDFYKPGDTVTLNWGKGTIDSGLTFSSYKIQYKYGDGDWTSKTITNRDTVSLNITTNLSESYRGKKISAKIQLCCTNSTYSSAEVTSTTTPMVNSVPSKPTVTVSIPTGGKGSDLLKAPSGGKRTITVTAGSANNSGQTAQVRYTIGGTTKTVNSPLTLKLESAGSYEYTFYTWDGVEKSSAVTKTVIINSVPTISEVTMSGTQGGSIPSGYGGDKAYIYNPTITVSRSGGQDDGTYTYKLYTSSTSGGTYSLYKTISTSDSSTVTVNDIRATKSPTKSAGYYYKIGVVYNDGIESSVEKQTSTSYFITKLPAADLINDKMGGGTSDTPYYSNSVTASFTSVSGYDKIKLEVYDTSGLLQKSYTANSNQATFNVSQNTTRGQKYTFKVKPYCSTFTPTTEVLSKELTRILLPTLGTPSLSKTPNPLVDTSVDLSFLNFLKQKDLSAGTDADKALVQSYGLPITVATELTLSAKNGSKSATVYPSLRWLQEFYSNSTCKIGIGGYLSTLFNASTLGLNKNAADPQKVSVTLSFKTIYGDPVSATWTQYVDFVTDATKPTVTFTQATAKKNGKTGLKFICEGCTISTIITPTALHEVATMQLQVGNSSFTTIVLDQTVNFAAENTWTFGAIAANVDNLYARIRITTKANQTSAWASLSGGLKLGAKRLVQGTGTLRNGGWKGDQITLTFQINDPGVSDSNYELFTSRVYNEDSSTNFYIHQKVTDSNTDEQKNRTVSITIPDGWKTKNFVKLKIKCKGALYPLGDTTTTVTDDYSWKEWYSNTITVYRAAPTLSYRKNQVGVNYDFSTSRFADGSLIISAHDNTKKIYFYSAEQQTIPEIDLDTRAISKFIIDGGSW